MPRVKYYTKDGELVPGVTTITSVLGKGEGLIYWAWNLGMQGIDFRKHRDNLADVGSLAHDMILCHLKKATPNTDKYSKDTIVTAGICFDKFIDWSAHHTLEPIIIEPEKGIVSEKYRYGGCPDYYGKIDGKLVLLDFKTAKSIYDDVYYQLAGYMLILEELGHKVEECQILRIGRSEDEGFESKGKADLTYEKQIFLASLDIYKAKRELKKKAR